MSVEPIPGPEPVPGVEPVVGDRAVRRTTVPTVDITGVQVADLPRHEVVDLAVGAVLERCRPPTVLFALHVGGLNAAADPSFVRTMNAADLVYADGTSVVMLGRIAGARRMERTTTTDIGPEIVERLSAELGRPPRVAIVGGPPGLAESAAVVLRDRFGIVAAGLADGYRTDYAPVLDEIRARAADVLIVAMGMPTEAFWVHEHGADIEAPLVLTAGGLLGFLTGEEDRAPTLVGRVGLEWVWRLAQHPRLAARYARGAWTTGRLAALGLRTRLRTPR